MGWRATRPTGRQMPVAAGELRRVAMRGLVALSALALIGAAAPPSPEAKLRAIIAPVSGERMKATVTKLVSFGTRHTLSSQTDPKRGIGAALDWAEAELGRYSAACGNCLEVRRASDVFTGDRIPTPTKITDIVAIQRGT